MIKCVAYIDSTVCTMQMLELLYKEPFTLRAVTLSRTRVSFVIEVTEVMAFTLRSEARDA